MQVFQQPAGWEKDRKAECSGYLPLPIGWQRREARVLEDLPKCLLLAWIVTYWKIHLLFFPQGVMDANLFLKRK